MKDFFDSFMTKDEQKIAAFMGFFIVFGMLIYYSGINTMFALNHQTDKATLKQATQQDSLIRIDIRTATQDELMLLPGIGEKRAIDIIAYREAKQFESAEELLNIKGIGAKTYLKMQPMLLSFGNAGSGVTDTGKLSAVLNPESLSEAGSTDNSKQGLDGTTSIAKKEHSSNKSSKEASQAMINLNIASKQDLMSLQGIGEVKADAIVAHRKQIGKFTTIEQLLDVKGIGAKTLEKNRHRLCL